MCVTKRCCDATRHKFPHVLTDFELPLNPLNVAVPVLSLDGVAVAHQLHKLFGQDAVLEGGGERQREKERGGILVTALHVNEFHSRNPTATV